MKAGDSLNIRYAELCSELGHLVSNREKIEARIRAIQTEIAAIDMAVGELKKVQQKEAASESGKRD